MRKTFNNFSEFVQETVFEFGASHNERLRNLFATATSLHQGCGCTRKSRAIHCENEYIAIGTFIDENSINILKMKWPGHSIEFANEAKLFFVIDP